MLHRHISKLGWATSFSALQRAEIAEIEKLNGDSIRIRIVSVLFNEPKLLKLMPGMTCWVSIMCFSALQRAEIAEIALAIGVTLGARMLFQCSSTSRNC